MCDLATVSSLAAAAEEGQQQDVSREADLSGAVSATLTFSYRRSCRRIMAEALKLKISNNGGTSWTTLQTYTMNGSDASQVPQSPLTSLPTLPQTPRFNLFVQAM